MTNTAKLLNENMLREKKRELGGIGACGTVVAVYCSARTWGLPEC